MQKNSRKRKPPKIEDWYSPKNYPHFDLPLTHEKASQLVKNPVLVAGHQFLPFMAYDKEQRRYRGREEKATKKRPIKYAAHRDGYIYSYYTRNLNSLYEKRLQKLGLSPCVIAYRKGLGSNGELAKPVFDEIEKRGRCAAIAVDVSGFFNSIDHINLEKELCETLEAGTLPADHKNVLRSLTRWSEVRRDECFERLGCTDKTVKRPMCKNIAEYRSVIKGRGNKNPSLVRRNVDKEGKWKSYGIPQGSPASALFSNIYMIPFDQRMSNLALQIGGFYRRYSDDIIWVCDQEYKDLVIEEIKSALQERGSELFLSEDKTEVSLFNTHPNNYLSADRPLQYLGFEFDGRNRLLRSSTLARYWRKVIKAVRSAKKDAVRASRKSGEYQVYRKSLNQKFTHLGEDNFITGYANRVKNEVGGDGVAISKQLSGHRERMIKEITQPKRKKKRKK